MNIHEYQAKELLKQYGVAVLDGYVAWTPEEAEAAAAKLPGPVYVVKSQIHAGGRGAGRFADDPNGKGGVRLAKSPEEVRDGRRGDDRPHADHQADRPGRPPGPPRLCRGRLRHRPRALSLAAGRPRDRAGRHRRLDRRRHGDRGGRRAHPEKILRARGRSGLRHFRLPCPQAGLRPRARRASRSRAFTKFVTGMYQAFIGARLRDRRDQPAGGDRRRRGGRARCQGELRRQRAVPPSGDRKAARRGRGGPEGAGSRQARA